MEDLKALKAFPAVHCRGAWRSTAKLQRKSKGKTRKAKRQGQEHEIAMQTFLAGGGTPQRLTRSVVRGSAED
jgi:hypothetical protein